MTINGIFYENSKSNKTFPTFDPYTKEKIIDVPLADNEEIDYAFESAKSALDVWSNTSLMERSKLINKLADELEINLDLFSTAETKDTGRIYSGIKSGDMQTCIDILR
jgi:acyl-CoA reductase-like NAD-dependent aldehyde dehydrogenase